MQRVIWLYWEGPMPSYVSLCRRIIQEHQKDVVVLDRGKFDDLFRSDRDINIDPLSLVHQSDFIRAYLLRHHGGLWVDADCIVLRDLAPLLDMASRTGFVGYREPQGYVSGNLMAARPGGDVIEAHYARVCARLRQGGRPLEWLDLTSISLDLAVGASPPGSYDLLPTAMVMPLPWNESAKLCVLRDDSEHARIFQKDAYCYMLSNNTIQGDVKTQSLTYLPHDELLRARYFASFLFRKALGLPERPPRSVSSHPGGHEARAHLDEGALDYLVSRFSVKTMVDVGCGHGGVVYYAQAKGLHAVGIDGDPTPARASEHVIKHDFTAGPLQTGEFDLGWSVELLTHIEEQHLENVMSTFRRCRYVFVTAAVPDHRPSDYWVARFARAGFEFDYGATMGVRQHSNMWSRVTQQNGMVFRRTRP